jgi:uncharacterized protein (DUF2461 family)
MPPPAGLRRLREAIVEDADGFAATLRTPPFKRWYGRLDADPGTILTRLPRGFDAAAPGAEWLRFKSFTATHALTDEEATSAALPDRWTKACVAILPLMRWLNAALGHRPATRR